MLFALFFFILVVCNPKSNNIPFMKKCIRITGCIFTIIHLLFALSSPAQPPSKMTYQAVVRNASNVILVNQNIGVRISILQASATGTAVFTETHTTTTNTNGLLQLQIGTGTAVSGSLASIHWANGPFFVRSETDPSGGTNYSIVSTQQLQSVPYAQYSGNGFSGLSSVGDTLFLGNGHHLIFPGASLANSGGQTNNPAHNCGASNVHNPALTYGYLTDQDGHLYKTISIGTQVWMAENLNTGHYSNGDTIPVMPNFNSWAAISYGICHWYDLDSANNNCPYGRLYNWYTIVDPRNVCPVGWHVPTDNEWTILVDYLGGEELAGGRMKTVGNQYWDLALGFNSSGFSALPSGFTNGIFQDIRRTASWWSSTPNSSTNAWSRGVYYYTNVSARGYSDMNHGNAIRCLKNASSLQGFINSIGCGSAINSGMPVSGWESIGVNSTVSYTGGNAGSHNGQTVASTGVTGLTASLPAGNFANGAGSLTYTISGTPSGPGTASFALHIGGQTCVLNRTVVLGGTITSLNCDSAANSGNIIFGEPAVAVSSTIPYIGGNGGIYNGQSIASTGVTGLTATLTAGTFATGAGSLTYTISGTAIAPGTAIFPLSIGGQTCNLSLTVNLPPASITALNCSAATPSGNLIEGVVASGVSISIPYTGGNGGPYNGQIVASTGVSGLTATLTAGYLVNGAGSLTYNIIGTAGAAGNASFLLSIGGQSCTLNLTVNSSLGSITALNCSSAINNGILTEGSTVNGVSFVVPYSGSNGSLYNGQTVNSTGVSGLTATLPADTFTLGTGSLSYVLSGTPQGSGTAVFLLNIGGQNCSLSVNVLAASSPSYPANGVYCANGPTTVVEVINPTTGKIWMDRNLGATQVATSSTDSASYGDLYQWGRRSDGHQCRYSATTIISSNTNQPAHGDFILNSSGFDWLSSQNNSLWQGISGINNPCPSGFRLPTNNEFTAERTSWSSNNAAGAFASPLKWSMAGSRDVNFGSLVSVGSFGRYSSSTVSGTNIRISTFSSSSAGSSSSGSRSAGYSVRCIKN
jgi:uncharacterized protein (TIGR02145 family)